MKALLMALFFAVVAALMVGCERSHEGYTPEAWERLKATSPERAQIIEWIDKSHKRRELERKYTTSKLLSPFMFYYVAEHSMLTGWDLEAALEHTVKNLEIERRKNEEYQAAQKKSSDLSHENAKVQSRYEKFYNQISGPNREMVLAVDDRDFERYGKRLSKEQLEAQLKLVDEAAKKDAMDVATGKKCAYQVQFLKDE